MRAPAPRRRVLLLIPAGLLLAGAASDASDERAGYERAYGLWREAQLLYPDGDARQRSTLLSDAREQIEEVLGERPEDLESRILLGAILSEQASESALARLRLGRRAHSLALENLERAPDNPRALLQRGILYLFSPAVFGGDLDAAIAALREAHRQLSAPDPPWPHWGRTDSAAYLGQALARAGRQAEARRIYREELARDPEARWIRDELLPELERQMAGGEP